MLTKKILLAAALGVLACLVLAAAPQRETTHFSLTGALKPLAGGSYLFSATITDLQSGKAVSAPQLRFANGDTAAVTIESGGEEALKLTVTADKASGRAMVDLVELRGAASTTLSRLDLQLQ